MAAWCHAYVPCMELELSAVNDKKHRLGDADEKLDQMIKKTNQQVSPRLRLKFIGLRQPRDCLMRSRLYQCR